MNLFKPTPQEIVEKSLKLTDLLGELDDLIEKLYVLSEDICYNYIERINFNTERGKLNAEIDLNIVKVMMGVTRRYIINASEISKKLSDLSNDILQALKEEL